MHSIKAISSITQSELEDIIPGYSSSSVFQVISTIGETETSFSLSLQNLDQPFMKRHDYTDPTTLAHYNEIAGQGFSYGAFMNGKLAGFIIGENLNWNSTLAIREFGVSPDLRNQGIGKTLLQAALERAKQENLRGVLCETQTTNVHAIQLYQKFGFTIQGLDLSLYSNQDLKKGEVAIYLRKPII